MELRLEPTKAVLQLRADGAAIVAAAGRSGLDAAVPTCPGWTVGDLLSHLATIYAVRIELLRGYLSERPADPAPEPDVTAWFERTHAELVGLLRTSDLERETWTFVGPRPASFWTRRMAHETAIHRADAEVAAGGQPPRVDAVVAVDGIDELLTVFLAGRLQGTTNGSGETIAVHTPDERWHVTLGPSDVLVDRGSSASADALIAGTPSHVLYHLWGRLPADDVDVRGSDAARAAFATALARAVDA